MVHRLKTKMEFDPPKAIRLMLIFNLHSWKLYCVLENISNFSVHVS